MKCVGRSSNRPAGSALRLAGRTKEPPVGNCPYPGGKGFHFAPAGDNQRQAHGIFPKTRQTYRCQQLAQRAGIVGVNLSARLGFKGQEALRRVQNKGGP